MRSLAERAIQEEQMDAADLPVAEYRAVLGDLARVNRATLSARPTLAFLRRIVRGRAGLRVLDVGFGQGDMLRSVARWAQRRGLAAELVGVDLNPNSASVARSVTDPVLPITYMTGDYRDERGGFDVVISSLVAHHMSPAQLLGFLRFMEQEARLGWMINDLHRHRLAYLGFPFLARLMRWHRIVREDGQLSIARAFRREDWVRILAEAGVSEARIVRRFPFRLCVERIR